MDVQLGRPPWRAPGTVKKKNSRNSPRQAGTGPALDRHWTALDWHWTALDRHWTALDWHWTALDWHWTALD